MASQRGILGVKTDPKKQILFSFCAREGEEWPEDEDDSDYEPTAEERHEEGIKLTIKKSRLKKKSTRNGDHGVPTKKVKFSENGTTCVPWTELPPELLLKIFQCITEEVGAVPFLVRMSRVCVAWSEVARHPALWSRVDLSYGWVKSEDRTLVKLCPQRLLRVRELNLSSWKNLTDLGLEAIADHCPLLESLDISNCSKVKGLALQNLVTKCNKISKLNISFLNTDAVKPQTLKYLLEKCGPHLRSLEMSGNKYTGFSSILTILQNGNNPGAHCRHLEVLDVSNCWFSTDFMLLNLEKLQEGLPRLAVLRLANSKFRASTASVRLQAESPGFPSLKELSVAVSTDSVNGGIGINDNFIYRLLKSSVGLRLLDLRGTSHVTLRGLRELPITCLEQLYLTQSSVSRHPGLAVIMHKWRHSLRVLDLSWNAFPEDDLDAAMQALVEQPATSCLEVLHLSGTSISGTQVRELLAGCPHLTSLMLSSCRGLPRGMKRDYTSQMLDELRANIHQMVGS